ncbi:class I lanthipeptide [Sphingobacterium sp.]|uniref:class I lanthipeptide n=1 Tax=Sphingobacterium sp. TaxID=341027 RepID=UPI0028A24AA0|nr:class I lanthipeptide [Sphingobacterium sp.]
MKKKILKFSKQDIADLSQEEQKQIIGGAGTVGANCTVTCPGGDCGVSIYGCYSRTDTGNCDSVKDGPRKCDPESNIGNFTCYVSALGNCHTEGNCTMGNCTDGCPTTYGDATCNC